MTAPKPPTVRGFFASIAVFKEKVIVSCDLWIGVAVGVAAYILTAEASAHDVLNRLTGAGIAVSSALVGVVIAALAVIVAFLDEAFTALIDEATEAQYGGMEGQLFPFWFVTGLGITTILGSVGANAFASGASGAVARVLVAILAFLLVWTALGVFNVVSYLHATGVTKALWIRKKRRAQQRRDGSDRTPPPS